MKICWFFIALAATAMPMFAEQPGTLLDPVLVQACHVLGLVEGECEQQLELLGTPRALPTGAVLRIGRRLPFPSGVQITLRCADQACLPILVVLRRSAPPRVLTAVTSFRKVPPLPAIVHTGDLAILLQQNENARLTRRVRCLEGGRIGEVIRVREIGGREILRASVVRPGEVTASY